MKVRIKDNVVTESSMKESEGASSRESSSLVSKCNERCETDGGYAFEVIEWNQHGEMHWTARCQWKLHET